MDLLYNLSSSVDDLQAWMNIPADPRIWVFHPSPQRQSQKDPKIQTVNRHAPPLFHFPLSSHPTWFPAPYHPVPIHTCFHRSHRSHRSQITHSYPPCTFSRSFKPNPPSPSSLPIHQSTHRIQQPHGNIDSLRLSSNSNQSLFRIDRLPRNSWCSRISHSDLTLRLNANFINLLSTFPNDCERCVSRAMPL